MKRKILKIGTLAITSIILMSIVAVPVFAAENGAPQSFETAGIVHEIKNQDGTTPQHDKIDNAVSATENVAKPAQVTVTKLAYGTKKKISVKWTMSIRDWGAIIGQLSIFFEGRIPA